MDSKKLLRQDDQHKLAALLHGVQAILKHRVSVADLENLKGGGNAVN